MYQKFGLKDTKLKKKPFLLSSAPLSNREGKNINVIYIDKKKTVGKERWVGRKGECFTLFKLKVSQRT